MTEYYRDARRKIDPSRVDRFKADHTPDVNDRIEIGPTNLAFDEWHAADLRAPNMPLVREYRWRRLVDAVNARGLGGVLLLDPLNIRYATDSTNMQLWNTHNPFRAAMVLADGHMVLWDYKNSPFLADHNPLVKEVRPGQGLFYFSHGDKGDDVAHEFSRQILDLVKIHSDGNLRIAADKLMMSGVRALEARGFTVLEGEELTEKARSIKSAEEIHAMRCAIHSCEKSVAAMEAAAAPLMSEDEIWAVLHAENIKRGGEWIETRLLASGPRTNPWFQECGPRIVQENEILAFDTDLIGVYGLCVDISRTWFLGDENPRQDMIDDYLLGWEHIDFNMELFKPGASLEEIIERAHRLPERYQNGKYSCLAHGVGLCDEWPLVPYPDQYVKGSFDYALEPGMMFCIEALVSRENGDFSIKLEDQILITETGYENLTKYPRDKRLMGA